MGSVTRDLLPFAVGRNLSEVVTTVTVYAEPSADDDGSYNFDKVEASVLARVVALTQNEINRLRAGGITIQDGVSVSLVGEYAKCPDQIIRADGTLMKVVDFTIEEGATILVASVPALGNDGPTYGSGYAAP